jgi:GntR family uxuAB operon transcriptional repressor
MASASTAPRLYRKIADRVGRLIDRGEFALGGRLPAERDLAKRLSVSRPTVREAIVALEIAGRVEVRVGSGVYVTRAPANGAPVLDADELGPFDVFQARWIVEAETAALAARHATPADIKRIAAAFKELAADARSRRPNARADGRFHKLIAEASRNRALAVMVDTLWEQRYRPIQQRLNELVASSERRRQNIAEHKAILDAITRSDARAARSAMRRHLRNVFRQRLSLPR